MVDLNTDSKLRKKIKNKTSLRTSIEQIWNISQTLHDDQNDTPGVENGRHHVLTVEDNIWLIINNKSNPTRSEDLTHENLFILSAAACCHDLDKALRTYNKREYWPEGLEHGRGSEEFIRNNHQQLGFTEKRLAILVGSICRLHSLGDKFQTELDKLTTAEVIGNVSINLHKAAVILKTADILHTDSSRIRKVGFDPKFISGLDKSKYLARSCIDGWRINGDDIIINANFDSLDKETALKRCKKYMLEKEWPQVGRFLKAYGLPYNLKFSIESSLEGEHSMQNNDLIEIDQNRNIDLTVNRQVLGIVATINDDRNLICRNEYNTHAMGSAVTLLAVGIMLNRMESIQRSFDSFSDDLRQEEDFSAKKLQEHIRFVSHLKSILVQLIDMPSSESKNIDGAERKNLLNEVFLSIPEAKVILHEDITQLKDVLTSEIEKLSSILRKIADKIALLPEDQKRSASKDAKMFARNIKRPLKQFFKELVKMKRAATSICNKIKAIKEHISADWGDDIADILLKGETCRFP